MTPHLLWVSRKKETKWFCFHVEFLLSYKIPLFILRIISVSFSISLICLDERGRTRILFKNPINRIWCDHALTSPSPASRVSPSHLCVSRGPLLRPSASSWYQIRQFSWSLRNLMGRVTQGWLRSHPYAHSSSVLCMRWQDSQAQAVYP